MTYMIMALGLSLCANAWLVYRLFNKTRPLTTDAKMLLTHLMAGQAILKIEVLDPEGLFYRSRRG